MKKRKTVMALMIIAGLSKFVGFFREIVLSYFWGASNISDAYLISTTIPTTIFTFIGAGITTGFIPIYTEIKKNHGKDRAIEFINKLIITTLSICTLLIIAGEIFCGSLVKVFASGFDVETYNIALTFTRVSLFEIGFTTLMYIFTAFLQTEDSFIPVACASFPMNLMTIVAIILSSGGNYYYLCIGCLVASFIQAIFLIPFAVRKKYRIIKVNKPFSDGKIREMFLLAMPTIIGTSVNDINVLVDRTLASSLSIGGISALNYASKINAFLQGVIVLSIVSYIYPKISLYAGNDDKRSLNKIINEVVITISFILLPASAILLLFSNECISIVFGRGAFNNEAITMTSSVLAFYSIGMIANGLREVYSRVLFAYKDSKTPMVNGVFGMIINIVFNIVLSSFMGISGLALATSISSFFILGMLIRSTYKKNVWRPSTTFRTTIIKIIILTALMCIVVILSSKFLDLIGLDLHKYLRMLIALAAGMVTYIVGAFLLKINEVKDLISPINKKNQGDVYEN